jgi:hypothetical protein
VDGRRRKETTNDNILTHRAYTCRNQPYTGVRPCSLLLQRTNDARSDRRDNLEVQKQSKKLKPAAYN